MGLYLRNVKNLLLQYPEAIDFSKTATIGRQYLFAKPADVIKHLDRSNKSANIDKQRIDKFLVDDNFFVDNMLRLLGANTVDSVDYSDYEKATIIHDLNNIMDSKYHNQYSVVCDFGTIEHVFNVPVAMKNLMNMVKVGGHLIVMTVGNNEPGHGFYQFSPEFFFRTLTKENGFKIEKVILQEAFEGGRAYEIIDPLSIKLRVTYCSWAEMEITVIATKISHVDVFANNPQQSDYAIVWSGGKLGYEHQAKLTMKMRLLQFLSSYFPRLLHRYYCYRCQPKNQRQLFKPLK